MSHIGRPRSASGVIPELAADPAPEADLEQQLATNADSSPDSAQLADLVQRPEQIIAAVSPEQAKQLLRLLIKEIRVHERRQTTPTYRIPVAVRAIPPKVELGGLEPPTSWVRSRFLCPVVSRRVTKIPAYSNSCSVTRGRRRTRGDKLLHPKCTLASA